MRSDYYIEVDDTEVNLIKQLFTDLGVQYDHSFEYSSIDSINKFSRLFRVSLSKYELLYIQLSCKTGFIRKPDYNQSDKQQTMSSDMCQSPC